MKINISDFAITHSKTAESLRKVILCVWGGVLKTSLPDQKAYPKIILMFGYLITF